MFETDAEMDTLQQLLDASMGSAGSHLTSIVTNERILNAKQVVTYLQNVKHVSLATVNSKGEPIVAPLDGWFLHGQFIVGTADTSIRAKHLRARPQVSVCHVDGDNIGVWVHGKAVFLAQDDALYQAYIEASTAVYGSSPESFGEGVVVARIEARKMFAYAFVPEKYPESLPLT